MPSFVSTPKVARDSLVQNQTIQTTNPQFSNPPRPGLYISILGIWVLCIWWFHPRLISLLDLAHNPLEWSSLGFFVIFVEFAWLYGIYNLTMIAFAFSYKWTKPKQADLRFALKDREAPAVAILYTTYNDFVEASAESCVIQDYSNYTVYILDDSTDKTYMERVNSFASRFPDKVKVVRRKDRKAFKAGNMNHALEKVVVHEKYFAIADADEILPPDFLGKLVPIMETDPNCGFVQANHQANPNQTSALARSQGIGIDLHWKWYQPLRNKFGFVMFLGHGALLRREVWEKIGGFPDIVSEDLGFAIRAREIGYRGRFEEQVICYEDFPDTVRNFRVRHMKWTRGTCEFLYKEAIRLIRSRKITWMEKLDILFPTMNLPLTLLYFLFMLNANLLMPVLFGVERPLTLSFQQIEAVIPVYALPPGFNRIFTPDFFIITMLTFFAPVMCFIVGLIHRPLKLYRFLSHSTALYAALGPLSTVGVLGFLFTRKALFLVTGDTTQQALGKSSRAKGLRHKWKELIGRTHPDHHFIQGFEILIGITFAIISLLLFQVSFLGLCFAFALLPVMHYWGWSNRWIKKLVYIPFALIILGVLLGGMSAFGMQTVFFGYGFHF
jgi:cellulose synthase/poly-beta-1,6-N-acetylglucosamine synthase-like glycosyltransferase